MLISVELMLNGAGLALVASARLTPASDELGQLGALLVMGLAAAEATPRARHGPGGGSARAPPTATGLAKLKG